MMKMELQFFAHKKGVGSTKNGSVEQRFIQVLTLVSAEMTHCSLQLMVSLDLRERVETRSRFLSIQ